MKIRITLIIAILSGMAVTGFNFVTIRGKLVKLQADLKEQTDSRLRSEAELAKTRADLDHVNSALRQSNAALEAAVTKVAEQTKRAELLGKDLAVARQNLDEIHTQLLNDASINMDKTATAARQVKNLQDELVAAHEENKQLGRKVQKLEWMAGGPRALPFVTLPSELKAKVVAFDPKWNFVVLSAGEDEGVLQDGELLVNRNGKLIAKVVVHRTEKNRCIANVTPGWDLAEIREGDTAIPAHPSS